MFGVELIAAVIALGAIALAYLAFNRSLREKTYEEALAEQRGSSLDAGKREKKDKTKKLKKKGQGDAAASSGGETSPKQVPASKLSTPAPANPTALKSDSKKTPETDFSSGDEVSGQTAVVRKQKEKAAQQQKPPRSSESDAEKKPLVNVKAKKETEKTDKTDKTEKKVSESGDGRGKENERGEAPLPSARKPNVVQLELAESGHPEAIPKPLPKKEGKVEKVEKLEKVEKVEKVEKTEKTGKSTAGAAGAPRAPPAPSAVQKEAPRKKPLTVQAASNGPAHHAAGPSEYSEVLGLLKTVQLSDTETQNLLQVLIVKQSERHTEWVQLGKGKTADPATIAKRLMEDRERELHDEKQMNKALSEQLKDLKNLLQQDKQHIREATLAHDQATDKVTVLDHQLKAAQSRLKESQDKQAMQAMEVAQLTRRLQDAESRVANVIRLEKTAAVDESEGLTKELEAVRAERDHLLREVQSHQKTILHLEELNSLQVQTETQVRSADSAEAGAEVQAIQAQLEAAQEKEKNATQDREQLEKKVADLTLTLAKSEGEIENLVRQLEESQSSQSELKHTTDTLRHTVETLKESTKQAHTSQDAHLQEQVHTLTASLEGLKKQVDEVRNEGFEEAKNYYEPQITETRDRHRELIAKLFPSVHLDKSLNSGEWLQAFEKEAAGVLHQENSHSREELETVQRLTQQLAEVQEVQTTLQAEVERYRGSLSATEKKLRELESSVETEEEKWEMVGQSAKEHEHKCRHLETQLSEVLDEKQSVQRLLEERSSSVGEMEQRLRDAEDRLKAFSSLQGQLDSLTAEADRLKADLGEARHEKDNVSEEANTLRRHLADVTRAQTAAEERAAAFLSELTEIRNKSDSLDQLHREAVDLRQALDVEKDNAKKMAQELLRSRNLIQVGLESLRKEEETVSKLKEALESREHGLNGSLGAVGDGIGSAHNGSLDNHHNHEVSSAH